MFFSWQKEDDTTVSIYTEEELEDRENDNYLRPDDEEEELGKAMFVTSLLTGSLFRSDLLRTI